MSQVKHALGEMTPKKSELLSLEIVEYTDGNDMGNSDKVKTGIIVLILLALFGSYSIIKIQNGSERLNPGLVPDEVSEQIKSLEKMLRMDPDDYKTRMALARLYEQRGDYEKALEQMQRAIADAEKAGADTATLYALYNEKASLLLKLGKTDEAMEVLASAKKLLPSKPTAYNKTGNIFDSKNKPEKAKSEYLTAQKKDNKDPESYKNLAAQEFKKGNTTKALELLKTAVRENPTSAKAFENLGDGYMRSGKYKEAREAYQRSAALDPKNDSIQLKIAQAESMLGNEKGRLAAIDKALAINPKNARALELKGDALLAAGDKKGALEHYNRALAQKFTDGALRKKAESLYAELNLPAIKPEKNGKSEISANDKETAERVAGTGGSMNAEESLAGDQQGTSEKAEEWKKKGLEEFNRKEYGKAIGSFQKAVDLDSANAEYPYYLGRALEKDGKQERALSLFEKNAVEKNHAKSSFYAGKILYDKGEYAKSEKMFKIAVGADPAYALAWYALGLARDKQNDYDRAEGAYRESLKINPAYYDALFNLGINLKLQKKYSESAGILTKAISVKEGADVHYQLGEVYLKQQNLSAAEKSFRSALSLKKDHYEALFNLAQVLRRQGNIAGAESIYAEIPKYYPDDAASWYSLGKLREETGNDRGAEEAYQKAMQINPQYSAAYLNLSSLYLRQKNPEKAVAILKVAAEKFPASGEVWYNLGKAHHAGGALTESEKALSESVRLEPNQLSYILAYGQTLEDVKMNDEAIAAYESILKIKSDHEAALEKLGFLYYRHRKDNTKSLSLFNRLIELYPGSSRIQDYRKMKEVLTQ